MLAAIISAHSVAVRHIDYDGDMKNAEKVLISLTKILLEPEIYELSRVIVSHRQAPSCSLTAEIWFGRWRHHSSELDWLHQLAWTRCVFVMFCVFCLLLYSSCFFFFKQVVWMKLSTPSLIHAGSKTFPLCSPFLGRLWVDVWTKPFLSVWLAYSTMMERRWLKLPYGGWINPKYVYSFRYTAHFKVKTELQTVLDFTSFCS